MSAAIAYPDSLFSRPAPARELTIHGSHPAVVAQLLDNLSLGSYHPLHLVGLASSRPLASGYIELTTTGYHLHLTDTRGERRIQATAARLTEAYRALVSLLDDLHEEAP